MLEISTSKNFLSRVLQGRDNGKGAVGPVGMAGLAQQAFKLGPVVVVDMMAMVSLNLAVFNLLPIPILDGGVILMLLIEMIRRQDLSMQFKEAVFKVGFAFLMMLVVFVLYNDLTRKTNEPAPRPPPAQQQQKPSLGKAPLPLPVEH